jgi:aryl-alcohol dehydrogenase-like predicted oxidoreductase
MQYRPLGRSGLNVSLICLGTMNMGEQNTEAEGHAQLDYALDRGINFIDTAEMYAIPPRAETQGSTERIIGSWFAARGNRDRVILATKVVGRSQNTWLRDGGRTTDLSAPQINEAVEKSLKRLRTDYIDLYQVHFPDRPIPWGSNPTVYRHQTGPSVPIEETLAALDALVKAGKVRFIGLSNESAWGTMRYLGLSETRGLARVQSVQNAYSLLNRTYETALAEIGMREDVGLLAYSPLAQGFLSGKYMDGARPPGARVTLFNRAQRYEKPGAEDATRKYVALARELGLPPAQLALAFVNSREFVASNIIGATTMAQLAENIGSIDVTLSAETLERIDAIHQLHCNPCP